MVSHGGTIEPALVAALATANHQNWGLPLHHCDGARLTYDRDFVDIEFRRAPAGIGGRQWPVRDGKVTVAAPTNDSAPDRPPTYSRLLVSDRGVVELQTDFPGLVLREHAPADAHEYYELVRANRDHLTRHGDYAELVAATREETERRLAGSSLSVRCGIWMDERLIGHVSLVHHVPPRWGLGFWLSKDATGRGYMTASIAALLGYAATELMATEVLAGVTHGNHRSSELLIRLGFEPIEEFSTYTRYRLVLAPAGSVD